MAPDANPARSGGAPSTTAVVAAGMVKLMPNPAANLMPEHLARRGLTAAADRFVFESPAGGPLRYSNWRRRVWLPR